MNSKFSKFYPIIISKEREYLSLRFLEGIFITAAIDLTRGLVHGPYFRLIIFLSKGTGVLLPLPISPQNLMPNSNTVCHDIYHQGLQLVLKNLNLETWAMLLHCNNFVVESY